uniref:BTB/POZ domain-containing protein 19-like n=1 Tax=Saccoglossus kowalevskii TaxID=10224 RepID=A0ABM0MRS5_SACKO|nr:PREDICTED: BTB/POZ domain-containing protein 19-like [Saccoglossus kowalevskii]
MKGDISLFAREMRKLINHKDMSDVKFVVGENRRTIFAHRCVLSSRCEVFRAMFSDQAASGEDNTVPFILSDVDPEIFLAVLEFIYTNCVTLSGKIAVDVLASSIEYGLDELKKLCVEYLIESLSVTNACYAMHAAVTYGQDELRESCLKFIEENTKSVFKTDGFHEMSDESLSVVLESDRLLLDEMDILSCVKQWALVNSAVVHKKIGIVAESVISHVRLPLLSAEELKKTEQDNKKEPFVPVAMVSFAWKYHALRQPEWGNPQTKLRRGTTHRDTHDGLLRWDEQTSKGGKEGWSSLVS